MTRLNKWVFRFIFQARQIRQNYRAGGLSWRQHGVTPDRVEAIILKIRPGSELLWGYATEILVRAVNEGMFGIKDYEPKVHNL